jgi:ABC-type sugar transport system substrate-binding protein
MLIDTKNWLLGGLSILSASLALASPSLAAKPGDGLTICLSLDKMNASREGQVKLWHREAAELGVKLIEEVAGEDAQRQSAQIDTCIAQKVDGIIDVPWDYEAVLQDIERAHAAGIPLVTMDQIPADTSTVDFHIGADPHADGLHAAERLIDIVGDKPTKVVDLQGALSSFNGQGRDRGFKDGIKSHPNIKIVSEVPTEWRPEPVLAGMENALQANPDIGAVFVATDGLLPPVWSALKKVNRYNKLGQPNHVVVLSVDGDPQGCQSVEDGVMDAGYAQPFASMTSASLQAIIDLKHGKKYGDKERIQLVPGTEYTLQNLASTRDKVWGCQK